MEANQAMVKEITEKDAAIFPFIRVYSTNNSGNVLNLAPTSKEVSVYSAKTVEKTSKLPLKIPGIMLGMITFVRIRKTFAPKL